MIVYVSSVKFRIKQVICLYQQIPHENHCHIVIRQYEMTRTTGKGQLNRIICCATYFILMCNNTFHNRFLKSDTINLNANMISVNCTYWLQVLSMLSKYMSVHKKNTIPTENIHEFISLVTNHIIFYIFVCIKPYRQTVIILGFIIFFISIKIYPHTSSITIRYTCTHFSLKKRYEHFKYLFKKQYLNYYLR